MPAPRFHAILFVKDEGDIIAQTLAHLVTWCDAVYVFDTGSTDETWEVVLEAAARDERVVPEFRADVLFHSGLRAWGFERVRSRATVGDWFARVDADEFYHVCPREFIEERLGRTDGRLCAQLYDFVLTTRDVRAWEAGEEGIADRGRPIEDRRRVWRINEWPELRLFRYRRHMRWRPSEFNPTNGGLLAGARIPVRHYQCRDPLQLQRRCSVRTRAIKAGGPVGTHWRIDDWRSLVVDENAPDLRTWRAGEALPGVVMNNHRSGPAVRGAQVALYRTGLVHVLDRMRPGWDASAPTLPAALRCTDASVS